MPMLRELQQAFGASILYDQEGAIRDCIIEDGFSNSERLEIYRNACRSALTEALRLTFPAVTRIVGTEYFDEAAARFIPEHPPQSGYLNDYGAEFADFLAALPSAAALRYLPEVARFEWALSGAANAPDAPFLDAAAVLAVDPERHGQVCFAPHPSVRFLLLSYPADQIADAVLSGDDEAMAAVDLSNGPVRVVVNRGPNGLETQRLDPATFSFVQRLCAGEPLGRLLESPEASAVLLAEQFTRGRLATFQIIAGEAAMGDQEKRDG